MMRAIVMALFGIGAVMVLGSGVAIGLRMMDGDVKAGAAPETSVAIAVTSDVAEAGDDPVEALLEVIRARAEGRPVPTRPSSLESDAVGETR